MTTSILILFLSIAFVFTGCESNHKHETKSETEISNQQPTEHHHDAVKENEKPVHLDNGKKWKANAETTEGVNKMSLLVDTYLKSENRNSDILRKNLEQQFNLVFQKCTMEGESHNQLHNFLMPLNSMFSDLNSENADKKNESAILIKKHLSEYSHYFE